MELLYAGAERVTGLDFVPFSILIVGALTFFGIGLIAYRYAGNATGAAFCLILGVLTLISFFVPRPVIYSYLLMILVMLAWDRPATRWTLPFLFWIWAAVHASFFVGLGYVGLMVLMRREWRALLTVALSGAMTLLTAHGLGAMSFLLDFTESREALQYLTEWRRPGIDDVLFIPYLGSLVFAVVGFVRRKVPLRYLWVFIPFAGLGFTSIRAVPQAWLGLLPMVALSLSGLTIGTRAGLRRPLAIVFCLFLLIMPFLVAKEAILSQELFPVAAAEMLADGRTFHDDRVGGYLIWAEGPDRKVYIDDRAELYGNRLGEFYQVRTGQIDWQPIFERDQIEQALLANEESLISELRDSGWQTVYSDASFTVLHP